MFRSHILHILLLFIGVASVAEATTPIVRIETNVGSFTLRLNPEKAPVTVANFMNYVSAGFYQNTLVHRVIPGFALQAGIYDATEVAPKPTAQAIKSEAGNGLSNRRGTIAMVHGDDPDSASAQFFLNLADNGNQLDAGSESSPDGYTVFGEVIDGMDAVDSIAALPKAGEIFGEGAVQPAFHYLPVVDSSNLTLVVIQKVYALSPSAVAGTDFAVAGGQTVTLDGSASRGATPGDAGPLTFRWTQTGGTKVAILDAEGATPRFVAPFSAVEQVLTFTLVVTDAAGNASAPATINVTVGASANAAMNALDCQGAFAEPSLLWPPSRAMKRVTLRGIAGPNPYRLTINQVSSDEPARNKAAGDRTKLDARILPGRSSEAQPLATDQASVRAERQVVRPDGGVGNGRVYSIAFTATDGRQSCTGVVKVGVPVNPAVAPVEDAGQYAAALPIGGRSDKSVQPPVTDSLTPSRLASGVAAPLKALAARLNAARRTDQVCWSCRDKLIEALQR